MYVLSLLCMFSLYWPSNCTPWKFFFMMKLMTPAMASEP